ncbi:AAA family ATPase, partial [Coleofasciculus sp.]|uniref:AAA family ATPase n=1 Tax=Coleofasciculus sp. TaxID=3100458 RepID=UPI003A213E06
ESDVNIALRMEFDILFSAILGVGISVAFGMIGALFRGRSSDRAFGRGIILAVSVVFIVAVSMIFTLGKGEILYMVVGILYLLLPILVAIVVIFSLLFLVLGGYLFITDNGSGKREIKAKTIVLNASIGLIASLVLLFFVLVIDVFLVPEKISIVKHLDLLIGLGMGIAFNLWRPIVVYPFSSIWNFLLHQFEKRDPNSKGSLLRWHSAFWDEFQRLPLLGLDTYLLLVMEHNPVEGNAAIEYLNTSRQRWAAQAAQIELDTRKLERCTDIEAIRKAYHSFAPGNLEGSANAILDKFHSISTDVDAALNQNSVYNQRIPLENVTKVLDLLVQELTRSSNEYAPRFRPIAVRWQQIVVEYVQTLIAATELHQEIDDPYIFGVPLNEQVQLFMGRTSIGLRIEKLILDRRRPPLLLYGQRRMGKTSLLNNLGRLLPKSIIPMFVDLQGAPTSASDHAGFLYNLAKGMRYSAKRQADLTLPLLTREALTDDPFTTFDEWLDDVEQTLDNNTVLLALDEFEVLDKALTEGHFSETDVLGMLRHLIQHRPRFKVLLAGSHTIEEFQRWASYLINVQVVHISYLNEPEARQLIERPIPEFTLRYEPDAVERVLSLTRCHPCLVQLLCSEIVALKNEQEVSVRRLATVADVEAAIPEALSSGSFFFADIERNQVDELGLAILRFLAAQGEGVSIGKAALSREFPDHLNPTLNLLLQRELIEDSGCGYGFQVELIRRWFARETGE